MFIGQKEVKSIEGSTVLFADGTQKEYTPKQLTYIVTEEEKDLTAYMNLVIDTIMAEIQPIIDANGDETDTVAKMLAIALDEHNCTQEQIAWIQSRIISDRITKHNEFMKATVGKEIEEFESDMIRYKTLCETFSDSHKRVVCIAVGKALGTYVEGEPFTTFWDEITYAHLKPFI